MKTILITISSIFLTGLVSCTRYYDCSAYYGAFRCVNGTDTIEGIPHFGQDSNWYNNQIQLYTSKGYSCEGSHSLAEIKGLYKSGKTEYISRGFKCTGHY